MREFQPVCPKQFQINPFQLLVSCGNEYLQEARQSEHCSTSFAKYGVAWHSLRYTHATTETCNGIFTQVDDNYSWAQNMIVFHLIVLYDI